MPPRSPVPGPKPESPPTPDESRRKLIIRGLAAAPLLLTLAARPVRAQAMGSLGCYDYGTGDDTLTDPDDDLLDPDHGRGRGRGGSLSRGLR
jgi:hypothetical protein